MVTFDAAQKGTPYEEWRDSMRYAVVPALELAPMDTLVVIGAHPDDETLGAGGLIAKADAGGIPVIVIIVTDGSDSHPHSAVDRQALIDTRSRELHAAVAGLSAAARVTEMHFADGHTREDRDAITSALEKLIPANCTIAAPWSGDGHRDHRIVGEICGEIASSRQLPLLQYPIWMWHWARPEGVEVPWAALRRFQLSRSARFAKRKAMSHYQSQFSAVEGQRSSPVLHADFLTNFQSDREHFVVTLAGRS